MADAPQLSPRESLKQTYPRLNQGFDFLYKSRGSKSNFDVIYPLRRITRDGKVSNENNVINQAILDIKVLNARKGKYYRVEWIGNGTTAFGSPNYDVLISEYDAATYATNSAASKKDIIKLNEGGSQVPSNGIFTQNLKAPRENIQFAITIDYSVLGTTIKSYPMNAGDIVGLPSDYGYTHIIDPACYVYNGGVNSLEKNAGIDAPLNFTSDMSDMQGALNVLRNGLLELKVYNSSPNKTYNLRYITKDQATFGDMILIDEIDNAAGTRRALLPTSKVNYDISNRNGISTLFLQAATGEIIKLTFDYSLISAGYIPPNTGTTHPFYTNRLLSENIYLGKADDINKKNFSVSYSKESDITSVFAKYGKVDDIQYVFRKLTVNQLFALYQMYTKPNANPTPNIFSDGTPICNGITDWIGPYIIGAVDNGDGTGPTFTGGAHSSDNNNTTGFPTAETISYQVYIDGKILTTSGNYTGDRVDIYVKNKIMSYNTKSTKRFTHEETVHYTITPSGISVDFEMRPYEKLKWKTYYGLQAVTDYYTHVIFPLGQYNVEQPSKGLSVDAGNKDNYRVNSIILSKSGTTETLELWMDNTVGLGMRNFVDNNLPIAFTREYNKTYMRLVGETPVIINPGEVYSWKGGYRFRK